MAPKPSDYFLDPADKTSDLTFLAAASSGNKVDFLVDGSEFFPAIEQAMADAKESIYCGFWAIYADTPLLSAKVKKALGVTDWQGLLAKKARDDGVKVRIITSDFDPAFDNDTHQRAWLGYNTFVARATKSKLSASQFQVFITRHPASVSGTANPMVASLGMDELKKAVDKLNANGLAGLANSPGIWSIVELKSGKLKVKARITLDASVATYHQKTAVIDNKIAFVGGINISDFYQNPPDHPGDQRAHDAFCRVEGPVVADVERNFVGRWNDEFPRFNTFVAAANAAKLGKFQINNPLAISALTLSGTTPPAAGNATAQLHRTVCSGISSSLTPNTLRDDVKKIYQRAISLANDYIYIENQYVRVVDVANWIQQRFQANKSLQVIIVVPVLPEELEEGKGDPITIRGVMLETDTLKQLQQNLGRNVGIYSLVQNSPVPKSADAKKKGLASFGSLRIYPHSKILMVDDVFASIGSANVNGRSFEVDSEANLGWYDADSVKALRQRLWGEHLGSSNGSLFATWKPADYVKNWDDIANKNTTVQPAKRQGFVVPHDVKAPKSPGIKWRFVPDWMAGLETRPDQQSTIA
jgi:phosphatidylserine/phosphatidylglycerophosphate/cardiolipin synthase-like enzyme